ncbi:MAG: LysR family transcriptional regulator [Comamonadaceae bacterium]|nr:MAG: LysR family transcriptional regulator [Comamonadaceae bacterium]
MNFVWLDDFLALAETGNFSRAAQARHVTQPAFSRRVRALEEWLGVPLFDRSEQPARLTVAGEWFRDVAQEVLARVDRIPGEAREVAEAHSATLRVAATHALSLTFLPRWLRALESHTALGPVLLMSDMLQQCEALMHQRKVEFVLSHAHPLTPGVLDDGERFVSRQVGSDLLVPVSAPGPQGGALHALDARRASTAKPVPVLHYSSDSGMGRITRAVFGGRLAALRTQVVFTAHLASVLRTQALDGRGVAWLPQTLIEDDLQAGRLCLASTDARWHAPTQIRLYRPAEPLGQAAEALWLAVMAAQP